MERTSVLVFGKFFAALCAVVIAGWLVGAFLYDRIGGADAKEVRTVLSYGVDMWGAVEIEGSTLNSSYHMDRYSDPQEVDTRNMPRFPVNCAMLESNLKDLEDSVSDVGSSYGYITYSALKERFC